MPDIVQSPNGIISCEVEGVFIPVACYESFTYSFKNELIGKTDVNAGVSRKKRVRISDGSAQVNGVMTLSNTSSTLSIFFFLQEGIRRTELTLKFSYIDEGSQLRSITGVFLIETIDLVNPLPESDTYDMTLQATGAPSISEVESPPDATCFETFSDHWTPSAAATSFSGAGYAGRSFAGHNVIEVVRESAPDLVYTAGTPGDGEYGFNGTTIGVWASNPFDGVERVFVIWQEVI